MRVSVRGAEYEADESEVERKGDSDVDCTRIVIKCVKCEGEG